MLSSSDDHEAAEDKARLTLTPAIFEITNITSLPRPFLSLLSVRPGESVLTSLTGPNHDDLSPISPSVLHYKPFLEVDGKVTTRSIIPVLMTGWPDIIEADLFEKCPEQVSDMAGRRGDRHESRTQGNFLRAIIRPDFAYENVYYPNPDKVWRLN